MNPAAPGFKDVRAAIMSTPHLSARHKARYLDAWLRIAPRASRNALALEEYFHEANFESRLISLRRHLDWVDPELFGIESSDAPAVPDSEGLVNTSVCRDILGDVVGPRISLLSSQWDGTSANRWPQLLQREVDPRSAYNLHITDCGALNRRILHALARALPAHIQEEVARLRLRGSHVLLWRGLGGYAGSRDTFFADSSRRRPHDYSAPPLSSFTTSVDTALGFAGLEFSSDGRGVLLVELTPFDALFSAGYLLGELREIVVRDHKHQWLLPLCRRDQTWYVDYSLLDNQR